jgi:chromosome segregation ATPase
VKGVPDTSPTSQPLKELAQRLTELEAAREEVGRKLEQTERERDEYRRVYLALLEAYRKLEAGLFGQKRERFVGADTEQLTLSLLAMLTNAGTAQAPARASAANPCGGAPS